MTGAVRKNPLMTVAELAAALEAPDLRILDASLSPPGQNLDVKAQFLDRHIPGAQLFDVEEIADLASPLPHMLPPPEKFASRMRKMGVGDGVRVVVYDGLGIFSAARVWWTFRTMGVEDVAVLDGGLPAWIAAGLPLEDGPARPRGERHLSVRVRQDLVRSLAEMQALAARGAQIIDARPAGRFEGRDPEPRPGLRGGHIPGSRSVPSSTLLTPEGFLKSPEALHAVFAAAGVDIAQPAAATCGSGVTAAIAALALARLGAWRTAVYDGSWAEWGARDDLPIATGPA